MKKVLGIMAVVAMSALMFTSCAKKCTCTYLKDGKKISVTNATKYYDKADCVKQSENYSWVENGVTHSSEYICK